MRQARPGPLYSPLGCGTTVLLGLALGGILFFQGGGPFSPGPLTATASANTPIEGFRSHAGFEGECGRCHEPWQGTSAERCESCHSEITTERRLGRGMHGRLHDVQRCARCHTDHLGNEADITLFDLSSFEHDRLTHFSLMRHAQNYDGQALVCADCHLQGNWTTESVDCATCHTTADSPFMTEHVAFYGETCLSCHDGRDAMTEFDHNEIFPLNGGHSGLPCQECHRTPVVLGTPNDCFECHLEPEIHAGQFGTDCARCHSTQSWTPARLTQHTFPLDHGGEGKIDCQVCHSQSYVRYTCYDCHAHDPAETLAVHAEEGITDIEACAECHPTGLKEESEESSFEGAEAQEAGDDDD